MKRLAAILSAFALCVVCAIGWGMTQPSFGDVADVLSERPYQTHMSNAQASNIEFVETALENRIAAGDNPKLLLGTSEFRYVDGCTAFPTDYFGKHNYGMDVMLLGAAWYQSIWQTIEVGALGDSIPDNKVVLFASVQWFLDYQNVAKDCRLRFSESAYERFCANDEISAATKQAVEDRLVHYGAIDDPANCIPGLSTVVDKLNSAFSNYFNRSKIKQLIDGENGESVNTAIPEERFGQAQTPDWDALWATTNAEGAAQTTSNSYGLKDDYYAKGYQEWYDEMDVFEQRFTDPSRMNTEEENDFRLFCDVCNECGIEPLIVIMPVKGECYDLTQYTPEVRENIYSLIRSICDEKGIKYCDLSTYEYDKYFTRDISHIFWNGWTKANEAIYNFFMGSSGSNTGAVSNGSSGSNTGAVSNGSSGSKTANSDFDGGAAS